jgi:hypothetical protein
VEYLGSKKGTTEVFINKLPGVPDGISRSPDGGFWVALVAELSPVPAKLAPYRWSEQIVVVCLAMAILY